MISLIGWLLVPCIILSLVYEGPLFLPLVLLLTLIPGGFLWRYRVVKKKEEIDITDTFEKEKLRWQQAARKWLQLYYCARCDGVFIPGASPFAPTTEMMNFIHQ